MDYKYLCLPIKANKDVFENTVEVMKNTMGEY